MTNISKNTLPEVSNRRKNKQKVHSGRINGKRSLSSLNCGPVLYQELPRADHFQIYESVYKNIPKYRIKIADLPDAIRTWKIRTDQGKDIDIQQKYNRLKSNPRLSEKDIKLRCPAITVNGCFSPIRNTENISALTGFLFLDYDNPKDPTKQKFSVCEKKSLAREKIGKHCLSIHRSFSGNGLHLIVRVNLKSPDEIPRYQEAISEILGLTPDKACSDITRFMIIPYDPEVVTTLFPEVFKLPEKISSRKVNGSDSPVVSQLEVPGIPPRVDAIIEYVDEHDLWGKARMQHNIIYGTFSKLLDEFTYPELGAFLKTDEFRLKLFHPDSITGKDQGKVLSQLKRINEKIQADKGGKAERKAGEFRKVHREIFFSDNLTWKARYVYTGLTMFMKYEDPLAEFWPSQETMAKDLRVSERTVRRGIKELIEAEIIIRGESKGRCNSYRMNGEKTPPFGKVHKEILFSDSLTWKAKYIYAGLTIYANKKGECKQSFETMAKDLRVSRDIVIEGIRELIKAEIISREKRKGRSNFYQLNNKVTPD